jgi:hypothetical protein
MVAFGSSTGPDGMLYFLEHILRVAFPDITVSIIDQVAESYKVTINVIDIIRLRDSNMIYWITCHRS